jgi:4-hydroxy-tetrahydrodipicolinate reductase
MVKLRVGVFGAYGRMGAMICAAAEQAPDLQLAGRAGSTDPPDILSGAEVVLDFTRPDAVLDNVQWAIAKQIPIVVGTSGFDEQRVALVREWIRDAPAASVVIVPNFSVSAMLAMRFVAQAAALFDSVNILDIAHRGKLDSPSGTATRTAELIALAAPAQTVNIQSLRVDGVFLKQQVVLVRPGELLTVEFNTGEREAYIPGIFAAAREAVRRSGLTVGLESILGI